MRPKGRTGPTKHLGRTQFHRAAAGTITLADDDNKSSGSGGPMTVFNQLTIIIRLEESPAVYFMHYGLKAVHEHVL